MGKIINRQDADIIEVLIRNTLYSLRDDILPKNHSSIKKYQNDEAIYERFKSSEEAPFIYYPKYYHGEKKDTLRISEQETRFTFISELEKYMRESMQGKNNNDSKFLYSIETPTKHYYRFKGMNTNPKVFPTRPDAVDVVSAQTDVCLYSEKDKKTYYIEFKGHNAEDKEYAKDFLKLFCDGNNSINFFVQVIDKMDSGTIKNRMKKVEVSLNNAAACLPDVGNSASHVIIFLFCLHINSLLFNSEERKGKKTRENFEAGTKCIEDFFSSCSAKTNELVTIDTFNYGWRIEITPEYMKLLGNKPLKHTF